MTQGKKESDLNTLESFSMSLFMGEHHVDCMTMKKKRCHNILKRFIVGSFSDLFHSGVAYFWLCQLEGAYTTKDSVFNLRSVSHACILFQIFFLVDNLFLRCFGLK